MIYSFCDPSDRGDGQPAPLLNCSSILCLPIGWIITLMCHLDKRWFLFL